MMKMLDRTIMMIPPNSKRLHAILFIVAAVSADNGNENLILPRIRYILKSYIRA
jgi:hypothetical protein